HGSPFRRAEIAGPLVRFQAPRTESRIQKGPPIPAKPAKPKAHPFRQAPRPPPMTRLASSRTPLLKSSTALANPGNSPFKLRLASARRHGERGGGKPGPDRAGRTQACALACLFLRHF